MKNQSRTKIRFLLSVAIMLLISGCGGGGGGGDSLTDDDSNPPPSSANINGGLAGRIFVQDGWVVDIATGMSRRVPGVIWDSWCLDYNDVDDDFKCKDDSEYTYSTCSDFTAYPSIDGEEYLVTITDCSADYDRDCLMIHDLEDGSVLGVRAETYSELKSGSKLSRNNNYIAYAFTSNNDLYASTKLTIVDRNYQQVSTTTMSNHYGIAFDWTNDGQLVYINNRTMYLTAPYSTEGTKIFSLDDFEEYSEVGFSAPRVSPDGTKVAFMLIEQDNFLSYTIMTPWVMNLDGTDMHRLSHVPDNMSSYQLFGSLAWSPDGKYILVTEGYSPQTSLSDTGTTGNLYAIPSASRDVPLNDEGDHNIIHLQTNYRNSTKYLRYKFNGGGLWWIP